MKRMLIGAMVLAVISVAVFFVITGGEGSSQLEQWISRVLLDVLNNYVKPEVAFESLDYQAPDTVEIEGLKITSADTSILSIDKARLTLGRIPKVGEPIKIKEIELTRPQLIFIKPAPEEPVVGWTDFVESESVTEPETVPEGRRISDILVLEHVTITEGKLIYTDEAIGETMTLPGIEFDLATLPAEGGPGWYQLVGTLQRESFFDLDIDGKVNIDSSELAFNSLELNAALSRENYGTFPPNVQSLLKTHDIHGKLYAVMSGRFPLNEPEATDATGAIELTDASVSFGENVFPVDSLTMDMTAKEAAAKGKLESQLLGGSVTGNLNADLTAPYLTNVDWKANNIQIEETLRAAQQENPKYAGKASTHGDAEIKLSELPDSISGNGELHLVEGRLMNMPLVSLLRDQVEKFLGSPEERGRKDKADIIFELWSDRIYIADMDLTSGTMVVNGDGSVFYEGRLDLNLSSEAIGGLTKRVPFAGDVAKAFNKKAVSFDVTGEIGSPKVKTVVMGMR